MTPPMEEELAVGSRFAGHYQILSVVGRGSMGVVYKARHELMGRIDAIKMLRNAVSTDEHSVRRFQREAKAAGRLNHPNLISVHQFGLTENHQPYLVMDFVEGVTLYELQRRQDELGIDQALHIFSQVCDALQHAHSKGVIHRDLKPSNIMLVERDGDPEFVKVIDLGIAKIAWGEEEEKDAITKTGEVCGSPIYLSPEQCRHYPLDHRTDIYSLGVVMYELLTGVPPLVGETVYDTIYLHVHEPPMPFETIRPELRIPARLERIVLKALEKNPEDRFGSMMELKYELQKAIQESDPELRVLPPEANWKPSKHTPVEPLLRALEMGGKATAPAPPTPVSLNKAIANVPKRPTGEYEQTPKRGDTVQLARGNRFGAMQGVIISMLTLVFTLMGVRLYQVMTNPTGAAQAPHKPALETVEDIDGGQPADRVGYSDKHHGAQTSSKKLLDSKRHQAHNTGATSSVTEELSQPLSALQKKQTTKAGSETSEPKTKKIATSGSQSEGGNSFFSLFAPSSQPQSNKPSPVSEPEKSASEDARQDSQPESKRAERVSESQSQDDNVEAYNLCSHAFSIVKSNPRQAIVEFKKALTLRPGYTDAQRGIGTATWNLGSANVKAGNLSQANHNYQNALKILRTTCDPGDQALQTNEKFYEEFYAANERELQE